MKVEKPPDRAKRRTRRLSVHFEDDEEQPDETLPLLPKAKSSLSIWSESHDLLRSWLPLFFGSCAWVCMKTTDTALLGHVGTHYLSAVAVSELWTSASNVFIEGRILTSFCGQALGSGNPLLAGVWLQVSLLVLAVIAVPVLFLSMITPWVLRGFGQPESIVRDATTYAWILATCIPLRVVTIQLEQYFQAQNILFPAVVVSTIVMFCNLVLGVVLVLGMGVPGWNGFGFLACPIVTASMEFLQAILLVLIFRLALPMHQQCWPGMAWKHITRERVRTYTVKLIPALLSNASDFWRWSTIGAFAAEIGQVEVGVFTASYRILWLCYTFIGALATAMSIKLGVALGAGDTRQAKFTCVVGCGLASVLLGVLGLLVFQHPRLCALLFSSDPRVQAAFEDIRLPFVLVLVTQNLAILLEQIPITMGRTSVVLWIGVIGSWVGQVPGVLLCFWLWKKDLVSIFTGVAAGYFITVVLLAVAVVTSDWARYSKEARERSEM